MKKATSSPKVVAIIITILIIVSVIFALWIKGVFYIVETQTSPNGAVKTTVYSRDVSNEFPKNTGFTVRNRGDFERTTVYSNATYENMWWSPDSKYMVVSMIYDTGRYLALNDYKRNVGINLNAYINMAIYNNQAFDKVVYDKDSKPIIDYIFKNWADKNGVMNIEFSFEGNDSMKYKGDFLYNNEDGTISNIVFN